MPPPQKRPTAVLVVAILIIIFGAWNFFGGCCGGFGLLASSFGPLADLNRNQPNPGLDVQQMIERVPFYMPFMVGTLTLTLLVGIGQLASGIGLLRMRPWARALALAVSAVVILNIIASTVYMLLVVNPVQREMMAGQMPPNLRGMMDIVQIATVVFNLFMIGIAVAFIVMLTRPAVRDAFLRSEDADALDEAPPKRSRPRDDDDDDRPRPSTGIREM